MTAHMTHRQLVLLVMYMTPTRLVLKDGDIMDNVIEDIVAQATSSSSSSEDEAEDTTG